MRLITFALAVTLVTAGMAPGQQANSANAEMKNSKGEVVGKVRVAANRKGEGVRITGQVKGLPPGEHGIHIHMTGKCDPPDFTTAGGHFNPAGNKHSLNEKGGHAGDLGNLTIGANGSGKIDLRVANVTLADGPNSLFKEGGTALMIHEKVDDLQTDPAGNAGGRIACGVFTK